MPQTVKRMYYATRNGQRPSEPSQCCRLSLDRCKFALRTDALTAATRVYRDWLIVSV